jgi:major vault protein
MIKGPTDYVPPVEAEVVTRRKAIPLDENEGIYIRDIKSGKVRAIIGETYMLNQDEELWEKALPADVERLLTKDALADKDKKETPAEKPRNKSSVVTYRVPHNGAVQIYDYKEKKARLEKF